jgi:hypothetical protein
VRKIPKHTQNVKTIYSTKPPVPLEALRLAEDIFALQECRNHLDTVAPENITEDRDTGWKILRAILNELRLCQTFAERKMKTEFIAPKRKKMSRQRK